MRNGRSWSGQIRSLCSDYRHHRFSHGGLLVCAEFVGAVGRHCGLFVVVLLRISVSIYVTVISAPGKTVPLWSLTVLVCRRFLTDQNTYFKASCMIRGSAAVVILPKLEFVNIVPGMPAFKWFGKLNASALKSIDWFSRT
jgi:hypothetical protein